MYPFPNLPPNLSREIFAELCRSLPPPAEETQSALDARDSIAMAAIAGLNPINATEAMLAVQVVLAEAHARDCLRLATQHRDDLPTAFRSRSHAAALMRQMHQALRALRQAQALRPEAEEPDQQPEDAMPDAPALLPTGRDEPAPWLHSPNQSLWPLVNPLATPPDPHPDPIAETATQLGLPRFAWAWVKPPRHGRPINGAVSHMKQH